MFKFAINAENMGEWKGSEYQPEESGNMGRRLLFPKCSYRRRSSNSIDDSDGDGDGDANNDLDRTSEHQRASTSA